LVAGQMEEGFDSIDAGGLDRWMDLDDGSRRVRRASQPASASYRQPTVCALAQRHARAGHDGAVALTATIEAMSAPIAMSD